MKAFFIKLQGQVRAPSKLQKLQLVYLYFFFFFFSSLKHIIKTLSPKKEEKDLKIKGVPHDKYTFNSQAKQCLIEKFGLKELFSNGSISIGGLQACFHIAHHYTNIILFNCPNCVSASGYYSPRALDLMRLLRRAWQVGSSWGCPSLPHLLGCVQGRGNAARPGPPHHSGTDTSTSRCSRSQPPRGQ